jgi:hypothetical protein
MQTLFLPVFIVDSMPLAVIQAPALADVVVNLGIYELNKSTYTDSSSTSCSSQSWTVPRATAAGSTTCSTETTSC